MNNIQLTEEEEKYLPCSPIMAIKSVRERIKCSLKEAKDIIHDHPKYKTLKSLYNLTCFHCDEPVCIECNGNRCTSCDSLIFEIYPKSVQDRLEQLIKEVDDLYIDNERIAKKSDPIELERYRQHQLDGCCGFADIEFLAPEDNEVYLIGFNYGH